MTGKTRVPEGVLRWAREALRRAQAMTDTKPGATCSFTSMRSLRDGYPTGKEWDADVKDTIRPYVQSWLVPDLESLLAYLEGAATYPELLRKRGTR
jgi:hypothetical protein